MTAILSKTSNWKFIVPLFLLFALFSFYLFPHYQSRMTEAAGEPVAGLDTRFSYTTEEVQRDFDALGPAGRDLYGFVVGTIDMIYPLIYGLLFVLVLAWLLKRTAGPSSSRMMLALLPLAGVLLDYLENINTLRLLAAYPDFSPDAVSWGERMTQFKHAFGLLSVAMAAFLAIVLVIRTISGDKNGDAARQAGSEPPLKR